MPHSLSYPGRHPDPPPDLSKRALPIHRNQSGWFRLHRARHCALFFGCTGNNRFDAPGDEYGVLYLGDSPQCAFAETYGRLDQMPYPIISTRELRERRLCFVEFERELQLVDLTGPGLAQLRADNRLCVGDYQIAQRWSWALWNHPQQPDGLRYRSRHDPSRLCLALFDRAAHVIVTTDHGSLGDSSNEELLAQILTTYGFGLID